MQGEGCLAENRGSAHRMPLERVRSPAAPGACSSMRMGCPSSATLSNWLLAFIASARTLYTTSAVPVDRPLRQQQQ